MTVDTIAHASDRLSNKLEYICINSFPLSIL